MSLITENQVETSDISRALPLSIDALRAGWYGFVTLQTVNRYTGYQRSRLIDLTLIFLFRQFWQPALGFP